MPAAVSACLQPPNSRYAAPANAASSLITLLVRDCPRWCRARTGEITHYVGDGQDLTQQNKVRPIFAFVHMGREDEPTTYRQIGIVADPSRLHLSLRYFTIAKSPISDGTKYFATR